MEKIKLLREKTGAGMVDCKNALDEANGDMDKAIEILRKKGIAKAEKRSGREASQGVIKLAVAEDNKTAWMVEINSETDFVARNQQFQDFANEVLNLLKTNNCASVDDLVKSTMANGQSVAENLNLLSGTIGEKLGIKRCATIKTNGTVGGYLHAGNTVGVLVAVDQADAAQLTVDLAMQVAAANPKYVAPEDVPTAEQDKEKEIYREQMAKENKPAEMVEKILMGKINKYFEDVCLIKQEYIKDEKLKVENLLNGVKVEQFIRYAL